MKSTEKKLNQQSDEQLASQAMLLVKSADTLSHEVKSQLADARQRAVNQLIAVQATQPATAGGIFNQWFDRAHHRQWLQYRTLSVAFAMMLVTFFAVQYFGVNDELENSDAFLLAAELPPEAFADKGFDTWVVIAHN